MIGHHELLLNHHVGIRLSQLSGNVISTYAWSSNGVGMCPRQLNLRQSGEKLSQLYTDQLPLGSQQRVLLLRDLEQQLTFSSFNFENELNNAASSFWSQMSGDVCEGRHLSGVN